MAATGRKEEVQEFEESEFFDIDAPVEEQEQQQEGAPISSQEFKNRTAYIDKLYDYLITLAGQVGLKGSFTMSLKKDYIDASGRTRQYDKEVTINSTTIRNLRSQIKALNNELVKEYAHAVTYKPKKGSRGKDVNLSMISESYRMFWQGANLGPVDPGNWPREEIKSNRYTEGQPELVVNNLPALTDKGISSSSLFQSAWADYLDANMLKNGLPKTDQEINAAIAEEGLGNLKREQAIEELKKIPKYDSHYYHVDEHMKKWLAPALDYLEQNTPTLKQQQNFNKQLTAYNTALRAYQEEKRQKQAAGKTFTKKFTKKKPRRPIPFDRKAFDRNVLSKITSLYIRPRLGTQPTPGQDAVKNDTPMTQPEEDQIKGTDEADQNKEEVKQEIKFLGDVRKRWNEVLGTGKKPSVKKEKVRYILDPTTGRAEFQEEEIEEEFQEPEEEEFQEPEEEEDEE